MKASELAIDIYNKSMDLERDERILISIENDMLSLYSDTGLTHFYKQYRYFEKVKKKFIKLKNK